MRLEAGRTARGPLHLGRMHGARFHTACWRTISARNVAALYATRRLVRLGWRHELRCLDCERLGARGARELVRVAGWYRPAAAR